MEKNQGFPIPGVRKRSTIFPRRGAGRSPRRETSPPLLRWKPKGPLFSFRNQVGLIAASAKALAVGRVISWYPKPGTVSYSNETNVPRPGPWSWGFWKTMLKGVGGRPDARQTRQSTAAG